MGKFTGNHYIWWLKPWFPVDFPLTQSIERFDSSPLVFQPAGTGRQPQAQVLRGRRGRAVAGDAARGAGAVGVVGAVDGARGGAGGETATAAQVGKFSRVSHPNPRWMFFFPLKPCVLKSILLDLSVFVCF